MPNITILVHIINFISEIYRELGCWWLLLKINDSQTIQLSS